LVRDKKCSFSCNQPITWLTLPIKTLISKPVIIIQPKIFYHRKRVVKLKSQILAKFQGASEQIKPKIKLNPQDIILAK